VQRKANGKRCSKVSELGKYRQGEGEHEVIGGTSLAKGREKEQEKRGTSSIKLKEAVGAQYLSRRAHWRGNVKYNCVSVGSAKGELEDRGTDQKRVFHLRHFGRKNFEEKNSKRTSPWRTGQRAKMNPCESRRNSREQLSSPRGKKRYLSGEKEGRTGTRLLITKRRAT